MVSAWEAGGKFRNAAYTHFVVTAVERLVGRGSVLREDAVAVVGPVMY